MPIAKSSFRLPLMQAPAGDGKQSVAYLKRVGDRKFEGLIDVIGRSGFGTL